MAEPTATQRLVLHRVVKSHRQGAWYRATSNGERVTLASLYRHDAIERRAWRGDGISPDSAFEYQLGLEMRKGLGLERLT